MELERPRIGTLLVLLLTACGGAISTPAGSNDGGNVDASANPPVSADGGAPTLGDGGTCVQDPRTGDPCVPGQVSCEKVVSVCCTPTHMCSATTKRWEEVAVDCICRSFACGDVTCPANEVCVEAFGGVPQPDGGVSVAYRCQPYPAKCEYHQTCGCLKQNAIPGCLANTCVETSSGNTVSCLGE